jgi:hypothetical protein
MVEKELDKRFGTIAIRKGFINQEQLIQAFRIQVEENLEKGEHRLIGAILLDLGLMTIQQIDEVINSFETDRK